MRGWIGALCNIISVFIVGYQQHLQSQHFHHMQHTHTHTHTHTLSSGKDRSQFSQGERSFRGGKCCSSQKLEV